MGGTGELKGPDLAAEGAKVADLADGVPLIGRVGDQAVMLVRRGRELFAVGATCTHYSGPLAEGLVEGDRVHCPWHHACFDLRTGAAIGPPALNPIACFRVEERSGRAFVGGELAPTKQPAPSNAPASVAIVGAGAAGSSVAEQLRREGYAGPIALFGAEGTPPIDRPNLSKDYLAGTAPEDWMALRGPEFYAAQAIDFRPGARVAAIDPASHTLALADGTTQTWGALVLATGVVPNRLDVPGAERPHVHTLRTLADSRAIIAGAHAGTRAVVIGSSFIGLEVAASLRARELEVHVVGHEAQPLGRVLGPELAGFVRALHEAHGVRFHLGRRPRAIGERHVELDDGTRLEAELVVVGVGVRPVTELAERAGLKCDHGIVTNEYLETSAPGVFAVGDVARWP
jgi:nitrite reductase/ring-hydroxylating ferredoxin subunit/thioredoxin reductase